MYNFLLIQYKLYIQNLPSIGIDKIKILANSYLTEEEKTELFKE